MRSAVGPAQLIEVPSVYGYESSITCYRRRPKFQSLIATRNYAGESALYRGVSRPVAMVSAVTSGTTAVIAWLPATVVDPNNEDTGLAADFPSSPAIVAPGTIWRKLLTATGSSMTLAQAATQAANDAWATDVQAGAFSGLNTASRIGLVYSAENLVLTYTNGSSVRVVGVTNTFATIDTEDVLSGAYAAWGHSSVPVTRNEVWICYSSGETLFVRRWEKNVSDEVWRVAAHSAFNTPTASEPYNWWDATAFHVAALPNGDRLFVYQAGPGQAMARTYSGGFISEAYPIMYADREYAYQQCRVTSLFSSGGRLYALLERGIEGSDGSISGWFTSIAMSEDGKQWMDWCTVGAGRITGTLLTLGGLICVVTPGRMYVAKGVKGLGYEPGNALARIQGWRYSSNQAGQASTGEITLAGYQPGDFLPEAGDALYRSIKINDNPELTYTIAEEVIDQAAPTIIHNAHRVSVLSRGVLRDGIEYQPPIDEVFLSGNVRHVEFDLQTVVTKKGTWSREDGGTNEQGRVIRVTAGPAVAILPQPIRPGNFWASVRITTWQDLSGLVLFYQGDMSAYGTVATTADYYVLEYVASGTKVRLYRMNLDVRTNIWEQSFSLTNAVADLAVHYRNGMLYVYVSRPTNIPYYTSATSYVIGHERNLDPGLVAWEEIGVYSWNSAPSVLSYVGIAGVQGATFRNLMALECDHVQTMGMLAQKIAWRSGIALDVPSNITIEDAGQVLSAAVPAWTASGAWYQQANNWMATTFFRGIDAEIEVDLTGGKLVVLGSDASLLSASPWCAGGLEIVLTETSVYVRKRNVTDLGGGNYSITASEVGRRTFTITKSIYKIRAVLFSDELQPTRSFLYLYLNGMWLATFVVNQATLGGYAGISGNGKWKGLVFRDLPIYMGDYVWSYRQNALDEVASLTKQMGYTVVEGSDGRASLVDRSYTFGEIGVAPEKWESLSPMINDQWVSLIRVVGAEIYVSYVVPELIHLGVRSIEINVPYLVTEAQCLSYAAEYAAYILSLRSMQSVEGVLDPRITLGSIYKLLDFAGQLRDYMVIRYDMTVTETRSPNAIVRAEMRQVY